MRRSSLALAVALCAMACKQSPRPESGSGSAPPQAAAFYVSVDGTPDGAGSRDSPWDLETALSHPAVVQPGDTIWLRGGTYDGTFTSTLTGSDDVQIIVRQYPGERAIVDGNLIIKGSATTYWGFEVMSSDPEREDVQGIDVQAKRAKLVNMIVHDHGGSGIGLWATAPEAEVYGTIIYNNGHQGDQRGHGHGIYAQNREGTKVIADNIVFNQYSHGIHVYGSSTAYIRFFEIVGNVAFNNGSLSAKDNAPDILVGGGSPAEGITVVGNMTYRADGLTTAVFGDPDGPLNADLTLRDNYIVGATKVRRWDRITATGNTFAGTETLLFFDVARDTASSFDWNGNTYLSKPGTWQPFVLIRDGTSSLDFAAWRSSTGVDATSAYQRAHPTGTHVVVRPNRYEPGRATIVVYNWNGAPEVLVDVGSVLESGARYELRSVQDLFGPPVAQGTHASGTIRIPLSGVTPPAPIGDEHATAPITGPVFDVFVLTSPSKPPAAVAALP